MTYTFSFCCQEYDNDGSRSQWMDHDWLTASETMSPWELWLDACLHPEHIDSEWEEDGFYQRIVLRLERGLFITRDGSSSFRGDQGLAVQTVPLSSEPEQLILPLVELTEDLTPFF